MKRFTHLTLALGTVALLTLLLILTMGAEPTVQATGDTIKVPDDHPTIQGAITQPRMVIRSLWPKESTLRISPSRKGSP